MGDLTWSDLSKRLRSIVCLAGGPAKGSDGSLSISFTNIGSVYVELGTYSIGAWSRHLALGEFPNERAAMEAVHRKLDSAERIVQEELKEDA